MILRNRIWNGLLKESEERLERLSREGYLNRLNLLPEVTQKAQKHLNALREHGSGPLGLSLLETVRRNIEHQPPKEVLEEKKKPLGKAGKVYPSESKPGASHLV